RLKTLTRIEKDSTKIVQILADHYKKHFGIPEINLDNPYHQRALEAYHQILYTPNIPLEAISMEEVLKQWKRFKP
ncbi:unnamed protein product, partial [Rotaria sp. Silwood2]